MDGHRHRRRRGAPQYRARRRRGARSTTPGNRRRGRPTPDGTGGRRPISRRRRIGAGADRGGRAGIDRALATAPASSSGPAVPAPVRRVGGDVLLQLSGITAAYGDVEVLHGVDLSIARGSILAMLGSNGAGKSTLCGVAAGLITPTAGHGGARGRGRDRLARLPPGHRRDHAHPRGPGRVPRADRRGEPLGLAPVTGRPGPGLRALRRARGAPAPAGRAALRWRTADPRPGQRAGALAQAVHRRRADARSGPARRRPGVRDPRRSSGTTAPRSCWSRKRPPRCSSSPTPWP